ncbi:uncharacterized protein LOC123306367 [Coccinella septempunctata]|uniref:uncharacterized protein LOC123306367 n=1 Tax=Coccinella septempunctata TaxID=41139 RepID=UPI001D074B4E|nr:uncharacterized protein LOC123306367 [Coccinella septempunctata]
MSKEKFDFLLNLIEKDIERAELPMQNTISAKHRLEITLRFLATGESFRSLMFSTRVHESSISRFVPEVCRAIHKQLRINHLKMPSTTEEWMSISEGFNNLWQFPHCLGALDGRHITFRAPKSEGSYHHNYKGSESIVLLALVDARYRFIYVNLGCNGRISDGGVFRNSKLSEILQKNSANLPKDQALLGRSKAIPFVVVADDAFPLKTNLSKPFPMRGLSLQHRRFNYRLSRARRVVENAFGILANRFRVLLNPISLNVEKVEAICLACVCLHNYLLEDIPTENRACSDITDIPRIGIQAGNRSSSDARAVREELSEYFSAPEGQVDWQDEQINSFNS